MQGDLNSAHLGCRWDYAQPLNKDIGMADNKLENFLSSTYVNRSTHGRGRGAKRHWIT